MSLPYFNFYPSDWLGEPRIAAMNLEEQGAYIRLLALMWELGQDCSLPGDDETLARMLGVSRQKWRHLRAVLVDGPMAVLDRTDDGRLTNRRLRQEWEKATRKSDLARQARNKRGDQVATDAPTDVPTDAPTNAGTNARAAVDTIASTDVGTEVTTDVGTDPGADAGADEGTSELRPFNGRTHERTHGRTHNPDTRYQIPDTRSSTSVGSGESEREVGRLEGGFGGKPPTPSGGLSSLTDHQRMALEVLRSVPGWPADDEQDAGLLRDLAEDFPTVNLLAEAKNWRTYKRDKPLDRKSRPRAQFRNWVRIASERQNARTTVRPADDEPKWPYYRPLNGGEGA